MVYTQKFVHHCMLNYTMRVRRHFLMLHTICVITHNCVCNYTTVCDGTQNFERYRYRDFFPVPNIFDTDTGTFFGTKFFRYRFQHHPGNGNFPGTGIPGTGTSHSGEQEAEALHFINWEIIQPDLTIFLSDQTDWTAQERGALYLE